MSLYLDTSLLVAIFARESATDRMQDWLSAQNPHDLSISDWTLTEFSSALSMKLRLGQIGLAERSTVLSALSRLAAESFTVLPVTRTNFRAAREYVDRHETGLRSGDALHLAVASSRGLAVHTLDRGLARAGTVLGLDVHLHA